MQDIESWILRKVDTFGMTVNHVSIILRGHVKMDNGGFNIEGINICIDIESIGVLSAQGPRQSHSFVMCSRSPFMYLFSSACSLRCVCIVSLCD